MELLVANLIFQMKDLLDIEVQTIDEGTVIGVEPAEWMPMETFNATPKEFRTLGPPWKGPPASVPPGLATAKLPPFTQDPWGYSTSKSPPPKLANDLILAAM